MHVNVLPIKRLPRHLNLFDYKVPEELKDKIKLGQLVTIPFRKSNLFGLVFSCNNQKTDEKELKEISSIVHEEPLVTPKHLEFIEILSKWYGVSMGTIAKISFLPMQKRKLAKIQIAKIRNQKSEIINKPSYLYYKNSQEHKKLFQKLSDKILILVPEVYLIDEVLNLIPKKQLEKTVIWHSGLSTKEKFEHWLQIRNNEKNIIIGTRAAVFLPIPNLKQIIIDYEHEENHKHWDGAPRFHAKDVATLLSKIHGAKLTFASYTPSVESYYNVHKKQYDTQKEIFNLQSSPMRSDTESVLKRRTIFNLINMTEERKAGNFGLIADKIQDAILNAKQDIFLFINRLGFATSVGCNDCGFVEVCANCKLPLIYHDQTKTLHCHYCGAKKPMPLRCPNCNSTMVQLRGVGTEQVETIVRKLIGQNNHEIVRIDSEASKPKGRSEKPRIIIGTEMAFQYIDWEKIELVVFLDIDKQLALPEFNSAQHVWNLIAEVNFRKNDLSTFYIQTFNLKHLVLKSLKEPDRFYRTDLNLRRSLGYPPYQYLVRYFYGHANQIVAKKQTDGLYLTLSQALTKENKSVNLGNPIEMHPRFYRGKFWYTILVKLNINTWQEDLIWLNSLVPGSWKIDPNPISILSP